MVDIRIHALIPLIKIRGDRTGGLHQILDLHYVCVSENEFTFIHLRAAQMHISPGKARGATGRLYT
ncbi:hypothetical protein [Dyadobacter tibetensis]|uniref:hypothetical protein n=1 Tax=Dyadobacter tibetensis TaxID=1211851 RepID=UPI00103E81BB|nr:hypothetical protein [Dyadobacter tibetensis]